MVSKARIRLSSTNPQDINTICTEIRDIADKTGVKLKGPIPLPTKKLQIPTRNHHAARALILSTSGKCGSINGSSMWILMSGF